MLLAGLLREPQLVTEACLYHGVTGKCLYFSAHRVVWSAVWDLVRSGVTPDLVGVWQTIQCSGEERELDPANPALWLAELYDDDPTGAWCDWACGEVLDAWARREAIHRANEVLRDAYGKCRETGYYEGLLR